MFSEDQEKFDQVFKSRGGLFEFDFVSNTDFPIQMLKMIDAVIQGLRKENPKLPPVFLNYISNSEINAVATKKDADYYIGINMGTAYVLNGLFLRMLAHPEILSEIGDVSKEKTPEILFNAQLTDFLILNIAVENQPRPVDKGRLEIAFRLSEFCFLFLGMHEYAHIIFGHVDAYGNLFKIPWVAEVADGSQSKNQVDPMFSQTCEFDADCYATNLGTQALQKIYSQSNTDGIPSPISKELLRLWFFAIYSMFRLFASKNQYLTMKTAAHPPVGIRQRIVFGMIVKVKERFGELTTDDLVVIMAEAIKAVEDAFDKLSEQGHDISSFAYSFTKESEDHLNLILANWNNVRPVLEYYCYGNLAPYRT